MLLFLRHLAKQRIRDVTTISTLKCTHYDIANTSFCTWSKYKKHNHTNLRLNSKQVIFRCLLYRSQMHYKQVLHCFGTCEFSKFKFDKKKLTRWFRCDWNVDFDRNSFRPHLDNLLHGRGQRVWGQVPSINARVFTTLKQ